MPYAPAPISCRTCSFSSFKISESTNPVHLVISDEDARAVLDLVNKTGLCEREPADVSRETFLNKRVIHV